MPIYEYECTNCKCRFDIRQHFDDEPVAECPKCKSKSKRLMVPAPVIFKGSGFYVTDYRGKSPEVPSRPEPSPSSSTGTEPKASPKSIPESKTSSSASSSPTPTPSSN